MRLALHSGRAVVAVGDGRYADLEGASGGRFSSDVMEAYARWDDLLAWHASGLSDSLPAAVPLGAGDLDAPVPRPRQVFAVALNYAPHAAEAGYLPPETPLVFTKYPTCIASPVSCVELPDGKVDWEAEMVAVVGRGGHAIVAADGWSAIAGLTVGQDLSERVAQMRGTPPQFSLAKSHRGFGPIGPAVVSLDELDDPDDLAIWCRLGDDVVQSARTSEMVFSVPALVASISAFVTLLPGDLIFTGTPAGVGNRRQPPRYLTPADTLTTGIDQLGTIVQTFEHCAP